MVIDDLDIVGIPISPSEDHTPLIIDPNRVKPLPVSLERFEAVARRHTQVLQVGRIMQIEQLSPGCDDEI